MPRFSFSPYPGADEDGRLVTGLERRMDKLIVPFVSPSVSQEVLYGAIWSLCRIRSMVFLQGEDETPRRDHGRQ